MPNKPKTAIPIEQIDEMIRTVRGMRVMLDRDLAKIYGVPTFRFNEAIKRNRHRFPPDFMFSAYTRRIRSFKIANCDLKAGELIAFCDDSWLGNTRYSSKKGQRAASQIPSLCVHRARRAASSKCSSQPAGYPNERLRDPCIREDARSAAWHA
jgi:hypothetical protein